MDITIAILTILLSILVATLPSYKKLTITYRKKTRFTKTGKIVGFIILALTALQIFQIIYNQKQSLLKEILQKKQLDNLDSLNNVRLNQNTKTITKTYSDGFAKYGLKYDTAKKEIERLVRDSSKTIIYNDIKPEIDICDIRAEIKEDTLKNYLNICVKQATAYKCNFNIYMLSRDAENKLYNLGAFYPINLNRIVDAVELTRTLFADKSKDVKLTIKFYYYIIGTYEDAKGKKFNYNQLINYNLKEKTFGMLTIKETIWIEDFYKKNGIK